MGLSFPRDSTSHLFKPASAEELSWGLLFTAVTETAQPWRCRPRSYTDLIGQGSFPGPESNLYSVSFVQNARMPLPWRGWLCCQLWEKTARVAIYTLNCKLGKNSISSLVQLQTPLQKEIIFGREDFPPHPQIWKWSPPGRRRGETIPRKGEKYPLLHPPAQDSTARARREMPSPDSQIRPQHRPAGDLVQGTVGINFDYSERRRPPEPGCSHHPADHYDC